MTTAHTMQGLFQSTRPQGARHLLASDDAMTVVVSIHAPARGATVSKPRKSFMYWFQSTRPQGARPWGRLGSGNRSSFNPRARKGRDLAWAWWAAKDFGFNPRARKGRDFALWVTGRLKTVSIHAPARGATYVDAIGVEEHLVSIHAPARGATVAEFALAIVSLFQSTRPQGARLPVGAVRVAGNLFQSTRPQGARQLLTS